MCFLFQAEDGIRYHCVTGVQTCALPISPIARASSSSASSRGVSEPAARNRSTPCCSSWATLAMPRSEERRVGKEGRSRWAPEAEKQKAENSQVEALGRSQAVRGEHIESR